MVLDVIFRAHGEVLPTDHSYALYTALAQRLPDFQDPRCVWRFAPITGRPVGHGLLRLDRGSTLRLRLPERDVPRVVVLAGHSLDVAGQPIGLSRPRVAALEPAAVLRAWLVTFRRHLGVDEFLEMVRRQLDQLHIRGEPYVPLHGVGRCRGQPQRRFIRVRGHTLVGYTLIVSGLRPDDSLRLQEFGLGGRTRWGCGFFVPYRDGGD